MDTTYDREILEKVEYLRTKSDICYEEALSMLERFDYDLTRVLIELERSNRINRAAPQFAGYSGFNRRAAHDPSVGFGCDSDIPHNRAHNVIQRIVKMFFHNNLKITLDNDTLMNLPVICYILLLIFAPRVTIVGIILMLLFGCHIGLVSVQRSFSGQDVATFASHAAQNVHSSISNISESIRKGFDNKNNNDDNNSGEGGEFTVE